MPWEFVRKDKKKQNKRTSWTYVPFGWTLEQCTTGISWLLISKRRESNTADLILLLAKCAFAQDKCTFTLIVIKQWWEIAVHKQDSCNYYVLCVHVHVYRWRCCPCCCLCTRNSAIPLAVCSSKCVIILNMEQWHHKYHIYFRIRTSNRRGLHT